ncbi:MAG: serine/threonine-protein kinase [Gemmataceae bacterium]
MRIHLQVIDGPHQGQDFSFARHDTFLVGRSRHAHFQLPLKDKYVSRIHFMVEINPPQCRLVDMGSHNGTFVNSQRVLSVDLKDGDQVRAGHSLFRVTLEAEATDTAATIVPAPAPSGEMSVAPDRIPGYNLLGKRREDSLGSVYEATRMADGLPVTLRLLVPAMSGNRAQVDAFLYEAQSLRTLEHPGIVRFVEGGDADGILFFVFEQERGLDAAKLLTGQGPFGERRALRVLDQALSALAYAHGQGMVHRDLKPSNIIIEGEKARR